MVQPHEPESVADDVVTDFSIMDADGELVALRRLGCELQSDGAKPQLRAALWNRGRRTLAIVGRVIAALRSLRG